MRNPVPALAYLYRKPPEWPAGLMSPTDGQISVKSKYTFFIYLQNKMYNPCFILREIYTIGVFDVVVVSILGLAEDGFHKLSEGYSFYMVLQYLM